jgi:hypothetical protein
MKFSPVWRNAERRVALPHRPGNGCEQPLKSIIQVRIAARRPRRPYDIRIPEQLAKIADDRRRLSAAHGMKIERPASFRQRAT